MKASDYPPGTKVKLSTDYPGEEPREVAGSKTICGFDNGYSRRIEQEE